MLWMLHMCRGHHTYCIATIAEGTSPMFEAILRGASARTEQTPAYAVESDQVKTGACTAFQAAWRTVGCVKRCEACNFIKPLRTMCKAPRHSDEWNLLQGRERQHKNMPEVKEEKAEYISRFPPSTICCHSSCLPVSGEEDGAESSAARVA